MSATHLTDPVDMLASANRMQRAADVDTGFMGRVQDWRSLAVRS